MQNHTSTRLTLGIIGTILTLTAPLFAGFSPVGLNASSFNVDIVVEKTAPVSINMATTATVDAGTNNTGNTFYEIGYNAAAPTTGFPLHGSSITDTNGGNHQFTMAPDYTTNDVLLVGHNAGLGSPILPVGTLTFTTPAAYAGLSFLNCAGNGPGPVRYVIHYADSSTEQGSFAALDWFNTNVATVVYSAAGRVNISGGAFANVADPTSCKLFFSDVTVGNPSLNIASVDFYYDGPTYTNGRAMIYAISGSTNGTTYAPLAVTGFNADVIVEAGASPNTAFSPLVTSASMDTGTTNTLNAWFEQGYYARYPNSGLPPSGSTFSSASVAATYTMGSYTANNAAMMDSAHATANLLLSTPASYGALSFLVSGANTPTPVRCVIQFQDGTSETNSLIIPDWLNSTVPYAWAASGRINVTNRSINLTPEQALNPPLDSRTVITTTPKLFDATIPVTNSVGVITNIMLVRTNTGGTQRPVVFALSGAPAGNVPPIVTTQPASTKNWAGSNIVLSASVPVGTSPTFQWQAAPRGVGGTFSNLSDNGTNILGSATSTLTITNASIANSLDYRLIASNTYGSVTSAVATILVLSRQTNMLTPGDPITGYQPNGGSSPAAQSVDHVIDGNLAKYLNYGSYNSTVTAYGGPVGFIVTPSVGATLINSVRLYTANDTQGRDPSDLIFEGSNDGGSTWNPIVSTNLVGSLAMPTTRNGASGPLSAQSRPLTNTMQEVDFANTNAYQMYRVSFPDVYTPNSVNSMQIGEVELLGVLSLNPPVITRQPPATATVYVGASPTFSLAAIGYPTPKCQWYINGSTPVLNATNTVFTFTNAQPSDSGKTISCVLSNTSGVVTSTAVALTVLTQPTQPYPAMVLADHPIGFWRLDESDDGGGNNGAVANDYWGGHTGIYTNTTLGQAGYNSAVDPDTAAYFGFLTSSDSYVGHIQDVDFSAPSNTTANFSVEAWVNAIAQVVDAGIVTKGTGGGGEQFNLDTGGSNPNHGFRFFFRDAGGTVHTAQSAAPLDNTWHHVVGVCDQAHSNVVLYVDGRQVATGAASPTNGILTSTSPVSIGARQAGTTTFNDQLIGVVDDVAIYNYALTSAQVQNHFFTAQHAPVFSVSPTNITVNEGTTATFSSYAYGPGTVTYQWYDVTAGDPGFALSGQTSSNLTFTANSSQNGALYRVVATNPYGSTTNPVPPATAVQLTVLSGPPSIATNLPSTLIVYAGRDIVLPVSVTGTAPFTYQWQSNGVVLADGGGVTGSTSNVLTISNSQVGDSATYQVFVSNASGGPVPSTACAVTVVAVPSFSSDGTGWRLNGNPTTATMSGSVLTLTAGTASTARSSFFNYPLNIGSFLASFTYQDVGGGGADGVAFVLQNDPRGTAALGGGGGSIGYSGITPSVALEFNVFAANTVGFNVRTNGASGSPYTSATPVNFAGGNPVNVTAFYNGSVLQLTFTDTVSSATFSTNISVGSIAALVGGPTAYVGFTGADGTTVSTQTISNFSFISYPTLSAQVTGGNSLTFTWPTTIGGYALQSRADLSSGSWQSVNAAVGVLNGQNQVTVPIAGGNQFYRLVLQATP